MELKRLALRNVSDNSFVSVKNATNRFTLMQKNEELETNLKTKHSEVQEINKLSLDASEKQLTDKIQLAQAA